MTKPPRQEEGGEQAGDAIARPRRTLRAVLWFYRKVGADPAEPQGYEGRWPTTRQAFLWDMLPNEPAPSRDGVVKPTWSEPEWVGQIHESDLDAALVDERKAHADDVATVAVIEGKASRLLTPTVTLLAGTIALAAFELKAAADARTALGAILPGVGAVLAAVGALWLLVAIVRALDADTRMGVYEAWNPELRLKGKRAMLAHEALGGHLASWTGQRKAERLMWARAAVSRAVVLLTIALLLGGVTILTRSNDAAGTSRPVPPCQCSSPSPTPSIATTTPTPRPGGGHRPTPITTAR